MDLAAPQDPFAQRLMRIVSVAFYTSCSLSLNIFGYTGTHLPVRACFHRFQNCVVSPPRPDLETMSVCLGGLSCNT